MNGLWRSLNSYTCCHLWVSCLLLSTAPHVLSLSAPDVVSMVSMVSLSALDVVSKASVRSRHVTPDVARFSWPQ